MCGRFSLIALGEEVQAHFETENTLAYSPRYNIAPGQGIIAIRQTGAERYCDMLRWGLQPSWAKRAGFSTLINARAETAYRKFRQALQYRRCLIPATGFYEWQSSEQGKQPFYIKPADKALVAFAGIWEPGTAGQTLSESCVLFTTQAVSELQPIHMRMPVILTAEHYAIWLDPSNHDLKVLSYLLEPPSINLDISPVSRKVNNAHYDAEDCIQPLST